MCLFSKFRQLYGTIMGDFNGVIDGVDLLEGFTMNELRNHSQYGICSLIQQYVAEGVCI